MIRRVSGEDTFSNTLGSGDRRARSSPASSQSVPPLTKRHSEGVERQAPHGVSRQRPMEVGKVQPRPRIRGGSLNGQFRRRLLSMARRLRRAAFGLKPTAA